MSVYDLQLSKYMADTDGPIGLFDSGIGGLSVLAAVQRRLPHEQIIYLADQAHIPYGSRSREELQHLTIAGVRWLLDQGAKLIVIACNSASAAALDLLRQTFPATPFVGMVPAVKPAVQLTHTGVVGVLATEATIAGGLLHSVVDRYAADVQVLLQPCPGLADAIEHGELHSAKALVKQYVQPLTNAGADTLVLGCTHYPLLANQIQAVAGAHVVLVDSAPAIAEQTARLLAVYQLQRTQYSRPAQRFATTGNRVQFSTQINRLWSSQQLIDQHEISIEDVVYDF
jgi:glutamate racemase